MNRYYVEILNHDDEHIHFYMYATSVDSIKDTIEYKSYYSIGKVDKHGRFII